MRTDGAPGRWSITENVPDSLGIAIMLRGMLGLEGVPRRPAASATEPPALPAETAQLWDSWWSHLVSARTPGADIPVSAETLQRFAGNNWERARDAFNEQKLPLVRRLLERRIPPPEDPASPHDRSGQLTLDVVPGDFPLAERIAPGYWVLSERSRLDEETLKAVLDDGRPGGEAT